MQPRIVVSCITECRCTLAFWAIWRYCFFLPTSTAHKHVFFRGFPWTGNWRKTLPLYLFLANAVLRTAPTFWATNDACYDRRNNILSLFDIIFTFFRSQTPSCSIWLTHPYATQITPLTSPVPGGSFHQPRFYFLPPRLKENTVLDHISSCLDSFCMPEWRVVIFIRHRSWADLRQGVTSTQLVHFFNDFSKRKWRYIVIPKKLEATGMFYPDKLVSIPLKFQRIRVNWTNG